MNSMEMEFSRWIKSNSSLNRIRNEANRKEFKKEVIEETRWEGENRSRQENIQGQNKTEGIKKSNTEHNPTITIALKEEGFKGLIQLSLIFHSVCQLINTVGIPVGLQNAQNLAVARYTITNHRKIFQILTLSKKSQSTQKEVKWQIWKR